MKNRDINKRDKDGKGTVEEESGGDNQNPKVFLLVKGTSGEKERRIATVKDLFTEARSNITMVDEGITYTCGRPRLYGTR